MNKNYYLVKINSKEDYYKCTEIYKCESEYKLIEYFNKTLASDMYVVSIEIVDFDKDKKELLKKVNKECKLYRNYKEI